MSYKSRGAAYRQKIKGMKRKQSVKIRGIFYGKNACIFERFQKDGFLKFLLHQSDYKCTYCGVPLTIETCTIDHYYPIDNGGSSSSENMVACCLSCNREKDNMPPEIFIARKNRANGTNRADKVTA